MSLHPRLLNYVSWRHGRFAVSMLNIASWCSLKVSFAWELYVALDGNINVSHGVNIHYVLQNVCELMRLELPPCSSRFLCWFEHFFTYALIL